MKKFLHKCVSNVYYSRMKGDSGFHIRIQRNLREKFLEICREQDKSAAQIVRKFIRDYVAKHEEEKYTPDKKSATRGARKFDN